MENQIPNFGCLDRWESHMEMSHWHHEQTEMFIDYRSHTRPLFAKYNVLNVHDNYVFFWIACIHVQYFINNLPNFFIILMFLVVCLFFFYENKDWIVPRAASQKALFSSLLTTIFMIQLRLSPQIRPHHFNKHNVSYMFLRKLCLKISK